MLRKILLISDYKKGDKYIIFSPTFPKKKVTTNKKDKFKLLSWGKEESPSSCLIKSRVHIFLSNHYLDSIVLLLFYRLWFMIVDTKKCQKKKETEKFIVVFFISL